MHQLKDFVLEFLAGIYANKFLKFHATNSYY